MYGKMAIQNFTFKILLKHPDIIGRQNINFEQDIFYSIWKIVIANYINRFIYFDISYKTGILWGSWWVWCII